MTSKTTLDVPVVFHSGMGHTVAVAKAVRDGILSVEGTTSTLIYSTDVSEEDWARLEAAAGIVFGCPTYMGSASAGFKQFMEESSGVWARLGWKDKIAAGFTNSGNPYGDKFTTLSELLVFALQHGMLWVGLDQPGGNDSSHGSDDAPNRLGVWIGAMVQSLNDLGVEGINRSDLETAHALGIRVARTAHRFADA